MSNVVHIELDRKNRVYRAGEVISGTIVVDGRVGQRAKRIVLRTWWETEGKGTATRGGKAAAILHEGAPPKGSVHRHGFHFIAPDAPFTYVGHHLSIEHHLQAVIELPMAPDLKVEEVFVLTPGAEVAPAPEELLVAVAPATPPPEKRPLAAFGLLIAVFGVFTLPFPGVLLLAGGLLAVGAGLRKEIASSRLGEVSVDVEPRVASPGDEVTVRVGIFPKQPVQVQGVTAMLRAQEICESQSGNNKKRHRHLGHTEEKKLLGSTVVPGELRREVSATFVVPALGMWSFKAPRNEVRWDVEVAVGIPSWPDWKQAVPIVVWPAKTELPAAERVKLPEVAKRVEPPEAERVGLPEAERVERPEVAKRVEPPAAERVKPPPMERVPPPDPGRVTRTVPSRSRPAAGVSTPPPLPVTTAATAPIAPWDPARKPAPAPTATTSKTPPPAPALTLDLTAGVEAILATRRYSPERKEQTAAQLGRAVEAVVVIERIDRPFGRTRIPGFENGRVVRGRLRDSDHDVEVLIPTTRADLVEGLGRGDSIAIAGSVTSWGRLPERPVIHMLDDDPRGAESAP